MALVYFVWFVFSPLIQNETYVCWVVKFSLGRNSAIIIVDHINVFHTKFAQKTICGNLDMWAMFKQQQQIGGNSREFILFEYRDLSTVKFQYK